MIHNLLEYLSTREELKKSHGADISEMPLIVADMKFVADDWLEDALLIFVTDKGEDERNIAEKLDMAVISPLMKRRSGSTCLVFRSTPPRW